MDCPDGSLGEAIDNPQAWVVTDSIVREPGLLTIEEHLASLLKEGETVDDSVTMRTIRRDGQVLGYIEVFVAAVEPNV